MMEPGQRALLIIRHAVENGSVEPITDADILSILAGRGGAGSHLRALFGDTSLSTIAAAAASHDIPWTTVLNAYRHARDTAAAANPELDDALNEAW